MTRRRKKRGAGEGTVYYDPKRERWIVQMPPDPLTGKRTSRSAKTEREALEIKRQLEAEQRDGRDLTTKQPTLAQFAATWLEDVIKPNRRATTHDNYEVTLRAYVLPMLGKHKLAALTPALLQRWANQLAQQRAPGTVHGAHARLHALLNVAVAWRYIASNPAEHVELPPLTQSRASAYTVKEAQILLASLGEWRLATLMWVLVLLGLRKGEALGLAWRNLDWEAATLEISQQVQQVNGKTRLSPTTKTATSRRVLPIPPQLLERLREHWREQQEEIHLRGDDWKEHGLIFPSEVGTPIGPRNFNEAWKLACARAKLRHIRVHDLRHTCATLLAEQGVGIEVRAKLLGHSAASITAEYTHINLAMVREAVEQLEQRLTEGTAGQEAGDTK